MTLTISMTPIQAACAAGQTWDFPWLGDPTVPPTFDASGTYTVKRRAGVEADAGGGFSAYGMAAYDWGAWRPAMAIEDGLSPAFARTTANIVVHCPTWRDPTNHLLGIKFGLFIGDDDIFQSEAGGGNTGLMCCTYLIGSSADLGVTYVYGYGSCPVSGGMTGPCVDGGGGRHNSLNQVIPDFTATLECD